MESWRSPSQPVGSSRCRLTKVGMTRMTRPLRSMGITPFHHYYGAVRPSLAHRYSGPHGSSACTFSLNITNEVLKFRTEAQIGLTSPLHRTPQGQGSKRNVVSDSKKT